MLVIIMGGGRKRIIQHMCDGGCYVPGVIQGILVYAGLLGAPVRMATEGSVEQQGDKEGPSNPPSPTVPAIPSPHVTPFYSHPTCLVLGQ